MGWLTCPGVVCYEMACGRVKDEREKLGRKLDEKFVRSLVHTRDLPTAVASICNGGQW